MKTPSLILILLTSSMAAQTPTATQDPAMQLEQIIHTDETLNQPSDALKAYRSLADDKQASEAIRLQAELRWLKLTLKQGDSATTEKGLSDLTKRLSQDTGTGKGGADDLEKTIQALEKVSIKKIDRSSLLTGALDGMAKSLSPHGFATQPPPDKDVAPTSGVGIVLALGDELTCTSVISGSPAAQAGISPRSVITHIDGKSPWALGGKLDKIVKAIRGPANTPVQLTIRTPDGVSKIFPLWRASLDMQPPPMCETVFNGNRWILDEESRILGMKITSIRPGLGASLRELLTSAEHRSIKGILLDLRDNGGGLLAETKPILECFLGEGLVAQIQYKDKLEEVRAITNNAIPLLPMVVLVNEATASAAEVVAAALQDYKLATIIGSRTYGKGEILQIVDTGKLGAVSVPIGYIQRSTGVALEREPGMTVTEPWGVTPDVQLEKPSVPPESSGQFELDAAIRHLKQAIGK
jgi:C-terminal peptidase prc